MLTLLINLLFFNLNFIVNCYVLLLDVYRQGTIRIKLETL